MNPPEGLSEAHRRLWFQALKVLDSNECWRVPDDKIVPVLASVETETVQEKVNVA